MFFLTTSGLFLEPPANSNDLRIRGWLLTVVKGHPGMLDAVTEAGWVNGHRSV